MKRFKLLLIFILAAFLLMAASPLTLYNKTVCYTETALQVQQYKFCATAHHSWTPFDANCSSSPSFTFTPYQPGWSYTVDKACSEGATDAFSSVYLTVHNGYNGLDGYDWITIQSIDDYFPPNWTVHHLWDLH